MGERRGHNENRDRGPQGGHAWASGLLGPYVLGALDPEEEKAVERHLETCGACQDEERGLRETHQRLAGASIAASSAPPELKARVLDALPARDRDGTLRGSLRGALAAAAVLLLFGVAVLVYSTSLFDRTAEATALAPTELAPGAGGEIELRGAGSDMRASMEVWGLPETGPNEYYELWLGREGGRVSAGTFTVDDGGRGEVSALCPEVVGGYERAGITLEQFPEEPRMDSARVMLRGDLRQEP